MSHQFYIILHISAAFLMIFSLGGQFIGAIRGQEKRGAFSKQLAIAHGLGMLFLFIAGFGLITKLSLAFPWPLWVWTKLFGMAFLWRCECDCFS